MVKNTVNASILAAHVSNAYLSALAYRARSPFVRRSPGDGLSHGESRDGGGVMYSVRTVSECVAHPCGQRAHKPISIGMIDFFHALHMTRRRLLHGLACPVYRLMRTG